jgi:hypothetical protein
VRRVEAVVLEIDLMANCALRAHDGRHSRAREMDSSAQVIDDAPPRPRRDDN